MMEVPDVFFLILPFLCIIIAAVADPRLAVAMYLLGMVSALLGVAFPYFSSGASNSYWFGMMYLGVGAVSGVMSLITMNEYEPPIRRR
jgi:hypothetical protein